MIWRRRGDNKDASRIVAWLKALKASKSTGSVFWDYYRLVKETTGVPSHKKVTALAAAGGVSDILFATDATEIVIVDGAKWTGDPLTNAVERSLLRERSRLGYLTGSLSGSIGLRNSLLLDLAQLNIREKDISPVLEPDGAWRVEFKWSFKGAKAIPRTVYIYPEKNLPILSWEETRSRNMTIEEWKELAQAHIPQRVWGSDILFQKGSESLPDEYPRYLPAYLAALKNDAWVITDDFTPVPSPSEFFSGPFKLGDIHTRDHPIPKLWDAMIKIRRPDEGMQGYALDLQVRRLLPRLRFSHRMDAAS